MDMRSVAEYAVWFLIYSVLGWIYESTLRSIIHSRWYNSGFLNGPYIPIYGFGAILDIFLLGGLKDPFEIFLLSGILNCILEYVTSWGMEKLFHARWWDYSGKFLNLNGRVCLLGFLAFGSFATVVILFFQPWLRAHTTDLMSPQALYSLSSFTVTAMSADTLITVKGMKDFEQKVNEFTKVLEEAEERITAQINQKIDSLSPVSKIRELRLSLQEKRLLEAFPDLRFRDMKYTAEQILQMIRDRFKLPM